MKRIGLLIAVTGSTLFAAAAQASDRIYWTSFYDGTVTKFLEGRRPLFAPASPPRSVTATGW